MSEELQQQLTELLRHANDATLWAGTQLPPLVAEKLFFSRVTLTLYFVVALSALASCVWLMASSWKASRYDRFGEWFEESAGVNMFVSIGAGMSAFATVTLSYELLMVFLAPRLFIIEWLRGLL